MLLEQIALAEAEAVADRIVSALRLPFEADGRALFAWASFGIFHTADAEPTAILRNADLAMYVAQSETGGAGPLAARSSPLWTSSPCPGRPA